MNKLGLLKNKKAMSIVISTVIIVAITITMSIAVAFWAMGIGNSLTKFEKLEIVSAYAENAMTVQLPGGGSGATAVATVDSNGAILSITVTNGGSGYNYGVSVSISPPGPGGTAASVQPRVAGGIVVGIDVISHGSGYVNPQVTIVPRAYRQQNYPVYLKIKNTGSAATTINNIFLDSKPYDAPSVNAPTPKNLFVTIAVGNTIGAVNGPGGYTIVYLPSGSTWNSGDYVELEIQTTAGRIYSTTVVLP